MKHLLSILLLVSGIAIAAPPTCYPPNATNVTVTLNPPSWTDWLAAANPSWVITWFCPSATGTSGYAGSYLSGYKSELLPNWASLGGSAKSVLDGLWSANTVNDTELAAVANNQLAATWPKPLKTIGTTVYYLIQQQDKYIAIPVGTAPVGTPCTAQSVNGMYGVPVASVTWYGSVKPLAVLAPCG